MAPPTSLECVESQIFRMNLSSTPTSSPRRRAASDDVKENLPRMPSVSPTKNRQGQELEVCYMSPRQPSRDRNQVLARTLSSPSVIDTSPKQKREGSITPSPTSISDAAFPPSSRKRNHAHTAAELTPITSNVVNYTTSTGTNIEKLSVPQAQHMRKSFPGRDGPAGVSPRRYSRSILPRNGSAVCKQHEEINLRSVSPPFLHQRVASASAISHTLGSAADPVPLPEQRHESPIDSEVAIRIAPPQARESDRGMDYSIFNAHMRAPEPYQPALDSRLASFGIVRDNTESIFLNTVDKRRSGQQTSEMDDTDDSDISVPSLHLATQLCSNTIDSYTTISGDERDSLLEDDEPIVVADISFIQPQWNCFSLRGPQPIIGIEATDNSGSAATSRPASNKKSSRYMSPEKEREIFDWLHSLEVGNNIVAEAASSKFLTGKMDAEDEGDDYLKESPKKFFYVPDKEALVKVASPAPTPAPTPLLGPVSVSSPPPASSLALPVSVTPVPCEVPKDAKPRRKTRSVAVYCGSERRLIVKSKARAKSFLRSSNMRM